MLCLVVLELALSRLRSGLSTQLGSLSFEGQGAFALSDGCRRRGLLNPLIYWRIAPSAWRLLSQRLRQISPALSDVKSV